MLIFFIFAILMVIVDYFFWKNVATPFIITVVPLIFLLFFNQLVATHFGFYSISNKLIYWLFLIGFASCFFASLFVRLIAGNLKIDLNYKKNINISANYIFILDCFFKVLSILMFFSVLTLLLSGVHFFDMKEKLGQGVLGIGNLLLILCIVFIYGAKLKTGWIDLIFLIISMIPLFLYGTRGWMFISILGAILMRGYCFNIWPKKITIISAPVLGIAFMMLTYLFRNAKGGIESTFFDTFQHVVGYFVGGIQGASQILGSQAPRQPYFEMVFSGFINLFRLITGSQDYVSNVGPIFFNINHISPNLTNVNTAFGTIFHGLGVGWAIVYLFLIYTLLYLFFLFKYKINNILFFVFYSVVVAGIFLSFFEYYLGLLFFVISALFLFILSFFSKVVNFYILKLK